MTDITKIINLEVVNQFGNVKRQVSMNSLLIILYLQIFFVSDSCTDDIAKGEQLQL